MEDWTGSSAPWLVLSWPTPDSRPTAEDMQPWPCRGVSVGPEPDPVGIEGAAPGFALASSSSFYCLRHVSCYCYLVTVFLFWLCWAFAAAHGLSSGCREQRLPLAVGPWLLLLQSAGSRVLALQNMGLVVLSVWRLPGPPAFPRNPRGRLGFPGPTQGEG